MADDDFWLDLARPGKPVHGPAEDDADARPKVETSPSDLGHYASHYLDGLWEELARAATEEAYNAHIAALVFHARHLSPRDHAELARLIQTPFKQGRGRPRNAELADAAERAAMIGYDDARCGLFGPGRKRELVVSDLARQFKTSKAIARRALLAAEKQISSRRR